MLLACHFHATGERNCLAVAADTVVCELSCRLHGPSCPEAVMVMVSTWRTEATPGPVGQNPSRHAVGLGLARTSGGVAITDASADHRVRAAPGTG